MGDPGPRIGVANGADECIKAVRQRFKEGSDVIKIMATGGVLDVLANGSGAEFTEDEIRAIVQTAGDYGLKVMAHAHGAEGIKEHCAPALHLLNMEPLSMTNARIV
jgi:imidazolonepropionase-like amidohydrolase